MILFKRQSLEFFYLSQSQWPSLQKIDLRKIETIIGKNQIGREGCLYLSQAKWFFLQSILLCIHLLIKRIIKWTQRDVII